jgi:hypothetical protein
MRVREKKKVMFVSIWKLAHESKSQKIQTWVVDSWELIAISVFMNVGIVRNRMNASWDGKQQTELPKDENKQCFNKMWTHFLERIRMDNFHISSTLYYHDIIYSPSKNHHGQ